MDRTVCFILGIAAGIGWYKFYILYTIDRITNTACDYCSFAVKRREMREMFFGRKGERHGRKK